MPANFLTSDNACRGIQSVDFLLPACLITKHLSILPNVHFYHLFRQIILKEIKFSHFYKRIFHQHVHFTNLTSSTKQNCVSHPYTPEIIIALTSNDVVGDRNDGTISAISDRNVLGFQAKIWKRVNAEVFSSAHYLFLGLFYLSTRNQNERKLEYNTGMHGLMKQKGNLL